MKRKIFLLLFLIVSNFSFAQPELIWIKEYDAIKSYDVPIDLCKDKEGNFIVSGTSVIQVGEISDYQNVILKYDLNGNLLWERYLNEPKSMNDEPDDMVVDDSSNIIIAGTIGWIKYLAKYDKDGNQKWIQPFPGSYDQYIKLDNKGNCYAARTIIINNVGKPCLTKYDINGNMKWYKNFDTLTVNWAQPVDLIIDMNDNIYLLGNIKSVTNTPQSIFVMKLDTNGVVKWYSKFDNESKIIRSGRKFVIDHKNDFYVLGSNGNIFVLKFGSDGELLWEKIISSQLEDIPSDIKVDWMNNIIICGEIGDTSGNYIYKKPFIMKLDSEGNTIFEKTLDSLMNYSYTPQYLAVDTINQIYYLGCDDRTNNLCIFKYNSRGDKIYSISKNVYGGLNEPIGFVLNDEDDFTITANCGAQIMGTNIVTFRYSNQLLRISNENTPTNFFLEQNYPNPFNFSTMISYAIPQTSIVELKMFNVLGEEIATLVNEEKIAGKYEVNFDASNLPAGRQGLSSGVYIYKLQAGDPSSGSGQVFISSKKMLLLK